MLSEAQIKKYQALIKIELVKSKIIREKYKKYIDKKNKQ